MTLVHDGKALLMLSAIYADYFYAECHYSLFYHLKQSVIYRFQPSPKQTDDTRKTFKKRRLASVQRRHYKSHFTFD